MYLEVRGQAFSFIGWPIVDAPELELADEQIGKGGMGSVHRVIRLGRHATDVPLAAKLFSTDDPGAARSSLNNIQQLQSKLRQEARHLHRAAQPALRDRAELQGLPIMSFLALDRDREVCGYLARLLSPPRYRSLAEIESEGLLVATPPKRRLELATDLARCAELLTRLEYVQGDINPPNIIIDIQRNTSCLIDFDGGGPVQTIFDRPPPIFKPGPWLAEELWPRTREKEHRRHPTHESEQWSLAILTHRLLCLEYPFFFLPASSEDPIQMPDVVIQYLREHTWPEIPQQLQSNRAAAFQTRYEQLDPSIRQLFRRVFNDGHTQPDQRPTTVEWLVALQKSRRTEASCQDIPRKHDDSPSVSPTQPPRAESRSVGDRLPGWLVIVWLTVVAGFMVVLYDASKRVSRTTGSRDGSFALPQLAEGATLAGSYVGLMVVAGRKEELTQLVIHKQERLDSDRFLVTYDLTSGSTRVENAHGEYQPRSGLIILRHGILLGVHADESITIRGVEGAIGLLRGVK